MTRYAMTKSPVLLLRSSEDWVEWRDHIQNAATLLGIWEYCDPATEKEDLPVLKEPKRPAIADADPLKLDDIELEDLKTRVSKYRKERAEYNEKRSALETIEDMIRISVGDDYWHRYSDNAYYSFDGPWKKLRGLSEDFGRPTEKKIMELEDQWHRIQVLADEPVVQEYVRVWESLFKKCVDSRILKSFSKSNRDKILLKAVMEPASGMPAPGSLAIQPWIEMPYGGWWVDDDADNKTEEEDGYWDFLSNTDADTNTTDDKGRSGSPSLTIGWRVPSGAEW